MNKKTIKIKKKAMLVINTNILTKKKKKRWPARDQRNRALKLLGLWWRVRDLINMVAATELQSGAEGREWKKEKETYNLGIREKVRKWYLRLKETKRFDWPMNLCVKKRKGTLRDLLSYGHSYVWMISENFSFLGFGVLFFCIFFFWHKT